MKKFKQELQLAQLTKLASEIKRNGAKAILQIFHAGRMTNHVFLDGEPTVAPSAVKAPRPNAEKPLELTEEEILEIIQNFGYATQRAIEAGFDGVEIHGANTYLLQQFFSPHSNRRNDRWGGSLEKRMAFPLAVVDEVLNIASKSNHPFAVGYRISPEELEKPGIRFPKTLAFIDQLAEKNLDYLHVSLRTYNQCSTSDHFNQKPVLNYVKDQLNGRLPLIGVGNIRTQKDVDQTLENADLVAIGQQLIVEPRFVETLLKGEKPNQQSLSELYKTIDISEAFRDFLRKHW